MLVYREIDYTINRISTNLCKLFDVIWEGFPPHLKMDRVVSRVVLYYTPHQQSVSYMNYNFFLSARLHTMRAVLDSTSISITFMKVYHSYVPLHMLN
jgi:hypothetical protein